MLNKPNGRIFKRCGVYIININPMKNVYLNTIWLNFYNIYYVTKWKLFRL